MWQYWVYDTSHDSHTGNHLSVLVLSLPTDARQKRHAILNYVCFLNWHIFPPKFVWTTLHYTTATVLLIKLNTIRYTIFMCTQKLTNSHLNLLHRTKKRSNEETKNKKRDSQKKTVQSYTPNDRTVFFWASLFWFLANVRCYRPSVCRL